MGRALCLSLALLFLANVNPSKAQKAEAEAEAEAGAQETRVTVVAGAPLALECRLRPEQRAEWRRDGGPLPADLRVEPELPAPDGRLAARLRASAARPPHAGLYTCSRERDQRVRLLVQPAAQLEPHQPRQPPQRAPEPLDAPRQPHEPHQPREPAGEAASAATAAGDAAVGDATEVLYDLRHGFSLTCSLPNENNLEYVWKKNDTNVDELAELKDRLTLERGRAVLKLSHAVESDFGNYSCALGGAAEQRWAVRGRPVLRQPANTNVVEGQKLKLLCKVTGKPYPVVSWSFSNESRGDGENDTRVFVDVATALGGRAALSTSDAGVPQGALELAAAQRSDAGTYRCSAPNAVLTADTVLRVKDMYAALWPFLGICAEVFVLCAIILVYEKRRTKPELDDSDTDNHDQKKS